MEGRVNTFHNPECWKLTIWLVLVTGYRVLIRKYHTLILLDISA